MILTIFLIIIALLFFILRSLKEGRFSKNRAEEIKSEFDEMREERRKAFEEYKKQIESAPEERTI